MKSKGFICLWSIALLAAAAFIMSCGEGTTSGWQGTIEKIDGITYIKNPKTGLWDPEETAVSMSKEFQIGELDGQEEYMFTYIGDAAVNSKGEIYIADRQLSEIRKFSPTGEYLFTIGQRGQGPGEFQNIFSISVNYKDELMVFDLMRRISIFSDKGELIQTTKRLVTDTSINPAEMFTENGDYILFGRLKGSPKLFHRFDEEWNLSESYIDYEFIQNKEFEEINLGFSPGHCIIEDNGDILYCKYLFDNKIFLYRNKSPVKIITRQSDIQIPYEVKMFEGPEKARELQKTGDYSFATFTQGKHFLGNIIQSSLGLFRMSDGKIVNFINTFKSKRNWVLGVEIYDPEGKFLHYAKLGDNLYYDFCSKNDEDLFYAIDRKDYHKVIALRLIY